MSERGVDNSTFKGVDPNPTCRAIVATVLWPSKRPQNHLLFRITPFCYLKIKNLIKNVEIQANCFGTRHFVQCEIPETSTNPASHTHRKGKPLPPKVQNGTLPTTVLRQFVSNWQTPGSNRATTMYADYNIHQTNDKFNKSFIGFQPHVLHPHHPLASYCITFSLRYKTSFATSQIFPSVPNLTMQRHGHGLGCHGSAVGIP